MQRGRHKDVLALSSLLLRGGGFHPLGGALAQKSSSRGSFVVRRPSDPPTDGMRGSSGIHAGSALPLWSALNGDSWVGRPGNTLTPFKSYVPQKSPLYFLYIGVIPSETWNAYTRARILVFLCTRGALDAGHRFPMLLANYCIHICGPSCYESGLSHFGVVLFRRSAR